jgi:hypothetical protein
MEDVLTLYHRPFDPHRPLVCFDEGSKQLVAELRCPLPAQPGQVARYDFEYRRNGTANMFFFFAPLLGWRHIKVTERRTMIDWAQCMRELVDVHFPDAETLVVVMDNLNTHKLAALYEAFPPAEARRIAEKLEIHYTPKHGSWLNMAEIELSVLARQCLSGRIPTLARLHDMVMAWSRSRNARGSKMKWQFTTDEARIKLHSLYPSLDVR